MLRHGWIRQQCTTRNISLPQLTGSAHVEGGFLAKFHFPKKNGKFLGVGMLNRRASITVRLLKGLSEEENNLTMNEDDYFRQVLKNH